MPSLTPADGCSLTLTEGMIQLTWDKVRELESYKIGRIDKPAVLQKIVLDFG